MRKLKRTMGKRGRKPGRKHAKVALHGKRAAKHMTPAKKARAATKALRERFAAFKAEAKQKLMHAVAKVQEKALVHALRVHEKREEARKKALAAAEAKFEKKFAKKLAKVSKGKRRGRRKGHKAHAVMGAAHHAHAKPMKRRGRRRGRPSKK